MSALRRSPANPRRLRSAARPSASEPPNAKKAKKAKGSKGSKGSRSSGSPGSPPVAAKRPGIRERVVERTAAALLAAAAQDSQHLPTTPPADHSPARAARRLAAQVEEAAHGRFGAADDYKAFFRSLLSNLRAPGNQLGAKIASGALPPAELVHLQPEDLASDALKQERKRQRAAALAKAMRTGPIGVPTSDYCCPSCRSSECFYFDHSTRRQSTKCEIWGSKDEEIMSTAIIKCKKCSLSWKVSN